MVKEHMVRSILGIIGNVVSYGLFLSPLPTFYRIVKNKAVEEFKPDPYIATVLNCMLWVFYAMPFVHPDSVLVTTTNGVGLGVELIYLFVFFLYATNKGRLKLCVALVIEIIFLAIVVIITLVALHGTEKRSIVVGTIADVFNIIMYASPLTVMAKVIKTRSVKYMPFWLSLANFLNGCIWTCYALLHPFDLYLLIANGIGAVSGAIQLILYSYFYFFGVREDPVDDMSRKIDVEMAAHA